MTMTWPNPTGTDGPHVILNAPLPPFDRRWPIHTVPLAPTSRTPAPTSLRCLAMRTMLLWVGLFHPPDTLTAAVKLPMHGSVSLILRH
jgi:hypothetical protein